MDATQDGKKPQSHNLWTHVVEVIGRSAVVEHGPMNM